MYDVPDYYLVANPLDRYSIGDRTPGLRTSDDGSVTIYMQHDSPGPGKESNWLPAPAGPFRPDGPEGGTARGTGGGRKNLTRVLEATMNSPLVSRSQRQAV
jgi:hypothetical protein